MIRKRGTTSALGGHVVVELQIPELRDLPAGQNSDVASLTPVHVVVDEFDVASQQCISHHYRHDADGRVRYGSVRFGYAWSAELDLMARLAGMRLKKPVYRLVGRSVRYRERKPYFGLRQGLDRSCVVVAAKGAASDGEGSRRAQRTRTRMPDSVSHTLIDRRHCP